MVKGWSRGQDTAMCWLVLLKSCGWGGFATPKTLALVFSAPHSCSRCSRHLTLALVVLGISLPLEQVPDLSYASSRRGWHAELTEPAQDDRG